MLYDNICCSVKWKGDCVSSELERVLKESAVATFTVLS